MHERGRHGDADRLCVALRLAGHVWVAEETAADLCAERGELQACVSHSSTLLLKLRRCHVIDCLRCLSVCLLDLRFFQFVLSGITLDADKRIVNVMKVYIERNNLHV